MLAFQLLVAGDHACFKRPEFASDLVSYDVLTPMAARGLFEGIHWTPAIRWHIDTIRVLRPIRTQWLTWRAFEDLGGGEAPASRIIGGRRDLRMACVLTDVAYAVTAHFVLTAKAGLDDSEGQHAALFKRRLKRGQFFRTPYLGHPNLHAQVTDLDGATAPVADTALAGSVDLGWMLYDVHEPDIEGPRFFRATMTDGVIDLTDRDSLFFAG